MIYQKGHKQTNTGRTHWAKGREPWNKGKVGQYSFEKAKTGWEITCKVCGKQKYFQLNEHKKRERKYCSPECYHKDTEKEELSYSGLHGWVLRKKGKAKECIHCGDSKTVDWAAIGGIYKKDLDSWLPLCRKHHIAYDTGKLELKI